MTVARILARKGRRVTSVRPGTTLRDVVDILADQHIGALIVTDTSERLLGIVSERDVVRAIARNGPDALDRAVSDYMTARVITAAESDSVVHIAQTMSEGRFRHMPVLENGRVVGIVSMGDAIKFRLEQMERDQDALREYIATA